MTERTLTLRLLTPRGGRPPCVCDTVRLLLPDDENGRGGGFAGIRRGHTPAVFALAPGPVTALADGKILLRAFTAGGYASVLRDVVTVITPALSDDGPV